MKTTIFGPPNPDWAAIAALLADVPEDVKEITVSAPARRAPDLRQCQHPNALFYDATVDNKVFFHLVQEGPDKPYVITRT